MRSVCPDLQQNWFNSIQMSSSYRQPSRPLPSNKRPTRFQSLSPRSADPVLLGFAENDARPPGNVTGVTPYVKGLPAKQLELAREIRPRATRIGLLDDVTDPKAHPQRKEIEAVG